MGRPRRTAGRPRTGASRLAPQGYGTAPAHGGAPRTGAPRLTAQEVWDGPGRGDNRGRRRAELRGGEAGPPFAQPRRGASGSIVSHGRVDAQVPPSTFRFRPQEVLRTTDSVDRDTSVEGLITSAGDGRGAGPPGRRRPWRRVSGAATVVEAAGRRRDGRSTRRRPLPRGRGRHPAAGRRGDHACCVSVVAAGPARHDRSISGLPARGYPWSCGRSRGGDGLPSPPHLRFYSSRPPGAR